MMEKAKDHDLFTAPLWVSQMLFLLFSYRVSVVGSRAFHLHSLETLDGGNEKQGKPEKKPSRIILAS